MNLNNFIILPTYNERSNVSELIPLIFKLHPDINILVVDDNSPDNTAQEVKNLQARFNKLELLEREKKEGLGRAYIAAFKEVLKKDNVDLIIMMDADFSHDPRYLSVMFDKARDFDLLIGSRYIAEGGIESWEKWRRFLSRAGNVYCRFVLRKPIFDWTAGFNCIKADFLRKIDFGKLNFSGYAFIISLKYYLLEAGAKVKEIPIIFKARREGESKLSHHIIWEGVLTPWRLFFSKTKK